jgi:GTP-binding protein Era
MVKAANTTLNEVDMILYLVEPETKIGKTDADILQKLQKLETPVFLCINKIDSISKEQVGKIIDAYKEKMNFAHIIPISAYERTNVDRLMECIREYLPEGPKFFPEDMLTDQPERQLVAELIREKSLHLLDQEIPHGIAVEIDTMRKREEGEIVDIDATIICERDAHKRIIIGKQGSMIKKIGTTARHDIERLLGSKIYLTLWVKIKKNWRDSDFLLKNYGFSKREID